MSTKTTLFAIFVSFALIVPLFTFPSILHFNEKYIGEGVDSYQFAAFQQLAAKNISESGWPFVASTVWRYPTGFDFSASLDGVFHTITGAFFILGGLNPVTANNLSIYLALFINLVCSFALFRYIYKSNLLAYFGSIIYGVSFYILARGAGHANLMLIGGFPLFIYALLRLRNKLDLFSLFIFFVSLLLIISSSLLYVAMLGGSMIIGLCISLFFYKKEIIDYIVHLQRGYKPLLITIGFISIIFVILFHRYILALINHTFIFAQHASDYAPSFHDYIIPNQSQYLAIFKSLFSDVKFQIENSVFLGYVEIVLFSLGIITLFRKKYVQFILFIFITFFIFSLGTFNKNLNIYLPYWIFIQILPFSAVQETGRYYVVFYLFYTLIILYFLQAIQFKFSKENFTRIILVMLILIILERIPSHYFQSDNLQSEYIKHVRETQTKAVLDYPLYDRRYDVLPFYYGKDIVSGYTHWSADSQASKSFIKEVGEERFACEIDESKPQALTANTATHEAELNSNLLNLLSSNEVKTIVVHKNYKLYWDNCNNVLKNYTNLFPHISQIQTRVIKKDLHYRWNSNVLYYSLFFPKDGELTIHNIHFLDSYKDQNVSFYLNNESIDVAHWQSYSTYEYGRWTRRDKSLDTPILVKAGDTLLIQGNKFVLNQGFFTLNYSFKPNEYGQQLNYPWERLEKKYEDNDVEVWSIN